LKNLGEIQNLPRRKRRQVGGEALQDRTAFTNLSSSPPTIYLNEYLIDDEEILEYIVLRELIHIKLHMYPPTRYGGLSYAEKFESNLYFLIPKEKVEEVRERIFKKLIEVNRRLQ
jgi:hypothetical protein